MLSQISHELKASVLSSHHKKEKKDNGWSGFDALVWSSAVNTNNTNVRHYQILIFSIVAVKKEPLKKKDRC